MKRIRWQHVVCPEDVFPDENDPAPEGWLTDKTAHGSWRPVSHAIITRSTGPRPTVLWSRLLQMKVGAKIDKDPSPKWAKGHGKDFPPRAFTSAILRCLHAITGKEPNPARCATSAKQVVSLWRAIGRPELPLFVREVDTVARACWKCPEPIFARDIRAEDWPQGTVRTGHVSTFCVQARWDTRLQVAKDWYEQGCPTTVAQMELSGPQRPRESPAAAPDAQLPSMRRKKKGPKNGS